MIRLHPQQSLMTRVPSPPHVCPGHRVRHLATSMLHVDPARFSSSPVRSSPLLLRFCQLTTPVRPALPCTALPSFPHVKLASWELPGGTCSFSLILCFVSEFRSRVTYPQARVQHFLPVLRFRAPYAVLFETELLELFLRCYPQGLFLFYTLFL